MQESTSPKPKIPNPPSSFEEDEKLMWELSPLWRKNFLTGRSQIKKAFLRNFILINLPYIGIAVLISILLNYFTEISIPASSLLSLSIGILTAVGAIMTIIFAFLTFWFSNAENTLQKSQYIIKSKFTELEIIEENIRPFTRGPRDTVHGELRDKTEKLAVASERFLEALKALEGRFSRASSGTYYDRLSLYKLDALIQHAGGKWYVAYCSLINVPSDQDSAMRIYRNSLSISSRIQEQNTEIRTATNQIKRTLNFTPILTSLIFIFIFSLIIALMSSTSTQYTLLPLPRLIFSTILVILLTTYLINIFLLLWSYISSKHLLHETNRESDLQRTTRLEERLNLDYSNAIKNQAKIIIETLKEDSPATTASADAETEQ